MTATETAAPFQIPMFSANGEQRWSMAPANRFPFGFQTEADARQAAELVTEVDRLRANRQPTKASRLIKQVSALSQRGL